MPLLCVFVGLTLRWNNGVEIQELSKPEIANPMLVVDPIGEWESSDLLESLALWDSGMLGQADMPKPVFRN
jgi:hypothetical protein